MKKNNKGFMLVEAIITSTVILTALIAFYSQFDKIYTKYNERNNYHDIDSLYASKEIFEFLLSNDYYNFNQYTSTVFNDYNYSFIVKNNVTQNICTGDTTNCNKFKESINSIKEFYNIKNLIISAFDSTTLDKNSINCKDLTGTNRNNCEKIIPDKDVKDELTNQTSKEYINYIIKYYDINSEFLNNNDYNYIIITEIEKDNNTYYSSLRIRWSNETK